MLPLHASPSGETAVPEGKSRLEKNLSEFFDLREGVTLITIKDINESHDKTRFLQT